MTKTATTRIGNHDIAIECLPPSRERDALNPALAAQVEPLAIDAWPLSAEQIADSANRRLIEAGGKPDRRDDCIWALRQIELSFGGYIFRPVTSATQRGTEQRQARRAHRRGELT